jgi:formylglycine-generating enzyme required for sulfatase activity
MRVLCILLLSVLVAPAKGRADAPVGETRIYLPLVMGNYSGPIAPEGMVYIPAGSFEMGCAQGHNGGVPCTAVTVNNELPVHTVYVSAFAIDRTEVSNGQYAQCVAAGRCKAPPYWRSKTRLFYYGNPLYDNYPVIYVDWNLAYAYCNWVGKRLPTEAEWEKTARGADRLRAFPWGDKAPDCSLANFRTDTTYCTPDTVPVDSYPEGASVYGALGMAGGVWEWVNDWYGADYYSVSPEINPTGPITGTQRVVRGGSWDAFPYDLRVANRGRARPINQNPNLGFRCALDQ